MTKKDYKLIADVVCQLPQPHRSFTFARFARRFERDNPRFDRAVFAQACGVRERPDPDGRATITQALEDYGMAEAQQDRDEQYVGLGDIDGS